MIPRPAINLTPLIGILLIVLLMFMVLVSPKPPSVFQVTVGNNSNNSADEPER